MSSLNEITIESVIEVFANEIATKQQNADMWYYVKKDPDMSSHILTGISAIKLLATKIGISNEVYNKAVEIYDFTNSGRDGYTLKDGKIVKVD